MGKRIRTDRDFAEEIEAHVALEADRRVEEGMDRDAALHAARRAFGNVVNHQERFYRSIRWMWLDNLVRDIRYGIRSLRRDIGLVTFATVIVGLGIGATVTVFSVTRTLLLRPLPFIDPDRLVWISNGEWGGGEQLSELTVQVAHLQDLRNESRRFADVAGFSQFDRIGDHLLHGAGEPERITRLRVTETFFPLLGVQPQLGRLFTTEESQFGGPPAVLLSHGLWARRFGADSTIVGRAIAIDDMPVSVVGVLPAWFNFETIFEPGRRIDYVAPFPLSQETNRRGNTLSLIGRLNPGATLGAAQAEATTLADRVTPDHRNSFAPHLRPLHEHVSGRFRTALYVLTGAVGLVMLIVCANLASLLLARGATKEKEIAVRAALGAARPRLIRQMLTETVVLTSAGSTLGFLLAIAGTRTLAQLGADIPLLTEVRIDGIVLGFTVLIALTTGIVLGVAPALRLSKVALGETLKESTRNASSSKRHRSIRNSLVVVEVALAFVLLVGAGLLLRSFGRLIDVDLGFQPRRAVTVRIDRAAPFPTADLRAGYYLDAVRRVRSTPGIEAAGLADILPMQFNRRWCIARKDCEIAPFVRVVSDGYLGAMGLSLLSGRDFSARDTRSGRPVIVVNETLAGLMWPGDNPLGRVIPINGTSWEVIGVVQGMRHLAPEQRPGPEVFFSMWQNRDYSAVHLIVRGDGPVAVLTSATRAALSTLDPDLPLKEFRAVQDIVDDSVSARRFIMMLLAGFAGLAVLLASLGIYGVISHSVSQRTHETGIRIALGAPAAMLRRQVLTETVRLAGAGVAVGLVAAVTLARLMQTLLFDVTAADPITFAAVPPLLMGIAALAGYLPARRASRIDPMVALNP